MPGSESGRPRGLRPDADADHRGRGGGHRGHDHPLSEKPWRQLGQPASNTRQPMRCGSSTAEGQVPKESALCRCEEPWKALVSSVLIIGTLSLTMKWVRGKYGVCGPPKTSESSLSVVIGRGDRPRTGVGGGAAVSCTSQAPYNWSRVEPWSLPQGVRLHTVSRHGDRLRPTESYNSEYLSLCGTSAHGLALDLRHEQVWIAADTSSSH